MQFRVIDIRNNEIITGEFVVYPDGMIEFPESGWDLHGCKESPDDYRLQYRFGGEWLDD